MILCVKKDCKKPKFEKGLCWLHYRNRPKTTLQERWHAQYEKHKPKRKTYAETYRYTPDGRFNHAKGHAKRRGVKWKLSRRYYIKTVILPCHYCKKQKRETGTGLDRIDNSLGYELNNVLPCCGTCNKLRGDYLTVEETQAAVESVKQHRTLTNVARLLMKYPFPPTRFS